ncbi:pentatricopeptide repeat-containing protein At4g38150-like isoform X2 [Amaranthus tricolor]|uniref:pentatricopeptide repeat-containing protein At4g38150-like isoform X2 n=1 Tax=Amaranthus tricolor TaxID=29722 RepID=UPI00258DD9FC|nr:pentatricopeptide repeat-containing protein At4g38150-like isoform X2 [Amaranthus tricolor]
MRAFRSGVDLVGDYKEMKDSQPSADKLSNKTPKDEQCIGKGGNEFLEKFKLGAVDKVGIKLDEATPMQSPEENNREAPANADEIFRKMKQSGLVPNAVAMINGLCNDGLIQEAMNLFRLMREKGAIPEVVVYTAVFEGFCLAQQFDKAKGIFRKMQNDGVVPNAYSYSVLIGGLCNGKRLDDAVEYSVEMLENGHLMNVVIFTGLVHGLCTEKGVEEARNTILMLKHKGLLLDEKEVRRYLDKNGLLSPMIREAIFGTKKPAKNEYPF